jgi:hypothetical protein
MLRASLMLLLFGGCAAAPTPAPVAPRPSAPAAAKGEPAPSAEHSTQAPVVPAAVPPPPAFCAELVAHPSSGCGVAGSTRAALAAALTKDEPSARDAALACLEQAEDVPPGSLRALRAELGPEPCADALVMPLLETPPRGLTPELESALLGLTASARLSRLLGEPPKLEPPLDKQRFMKFFAERLTPWVLSEAAAIEKLSREGARLSGYGRGLAAIAAGNADLRFVQLVREVPLPDEMRADKALSDAYYGQLDQALEPRKIRGRDAALVGLRTFAELGAVFDERVTRARQLLNELWAGSRIDALDRLLLPDLDPPDAGTPELVLAARLPTFYAKALLADADPSDAKLLRALLVRGVPAVLRPKLDAAKLSDTARALYARALVDSGRRFFRAADFKHAHDLFEGQSPSELGRLLSALAFALEDGPADATELMLKGPFVQGRRDVRGLDAESAKRGRFAGQAAYDAAVVLALAPLQDDAPFWDDLAKRFDTAQKLLQKSASASAKHDAESAHELADAARATAATLRGKR